MEDFEIYQLFIGKLIKQLRLDECITSQELISSLGLSIDESQLSKVEAGIIDIEPNDFFKVMTEFELDIDKFYCYIIDTIKSYDIESNVLKPLHTHNFKKTL